MTNNEIQVADAAGAELKSKIESIPDKMGFKIGEVAEYVGVKQYVLRYWETEFEALHPKKSENGQRFYTRKDIEMALLIRKLLHEDRFSIEGARAVLKKMKQQGKSQPVQDKSHVQTVVIQAPAVDEPASHHADGHATVKQVEKAMALKAKEVNQYWSSSVEYLVGEIQQARKRLMAR